MSLIDSAVNLVLTLGKGRTAGGLVTYRRGQSSITNLPAIFGKAPQEVESPNGIRTELSERDFIIEADAIILDGRPIDPEPGDTIETAGKVYEVRPLDNQPAAINLDGTGRMLRIHTKRIGRQ